MANSSHSPSETGTRTSPDHAGSTEVMNQFIANVYDVMPYESNPFPQTTPEHLQAVAHLFGLEAPPVAKARVLELGCSFGGNLMPMAKRYPKAQFVGVDLSTVQIEQGQIALKEQGIDNVLLRHGSIEDIDASWGQFDYIICHGVYSWVPDRVQDAILRVSSDNLTPDGIAYISYNTYPGWKFREILRDAMMLRGSTRANPMEQLSFAKGMVEFLHDKAPEGSALKVALEENISIIKNGHPYYLIHEFLEPCNAPCYFKDFLNRAVGHGLVYLADSEPSMMFAGNYSQHVAEPLLKECKTQVELEQYLDFVSNRSFRQTLLVKSHRATQIRYNLNANRGQNIHIAGSFVPPVEQKQVVDPKLRVNWRGNQVRFNTPVALAMADKLNNLYPGTTSADQLAQELSETLGVPPQELLPVILKTIEELRIQGHIRTRLFPAHCAHVLTDKPVCASSTFTWMLSPKEQGQDHRYFASNEWHEMASLTVVEWHLLRVMDGQLSQADLAQSVQEQVTKEQIRFWRDGQQITNVEELQTMSELQTQTALQRLLRLGLLG